MTHSAPSTTLMMLLLAGAGCVTNPVPEPMPLTTPNVERVYLSDAPGTVAGLPEAAEFSAEDPENPNEVVVYNTRTEVTATGLVQSDGSFLIELVANGSDPIDIWLRQGDRESPIAELIRPSASPTVVPPEIDGVETVGVGEARVTGTWGPGSLVIVGNQDRGWVASETIGSSGDFAVTIDAQPGDWLLVFFIESSSRTSVPGATVQVPVL